MDCKISVIEHSLVLPPLGTVAGKSLPLTFCDLLNMFYDPVQSLFFYEYPNCDPDILIPNLRNSLSITLKHFFPFAGNLILHPPNTTTKDEIRYAEGDSVPITFATYNGDFDYITEKNPLCVMELLPFSAQLPSCSVADGTLLAPVLAIQVTFLKNDGICIGITRDHVIGDASTWVNFVRAWALITKTSSDESLLVSNCVPSFDRSVITDSKDTYNFHLSRIDNLQERFKAKYSRQPTQDLSRGTFIITQPEIQDLKNSALQKMINSKQVSSFVVVSAYVWTCLAKARDDMCNEEFWCAVAARGRVHPIPDNYFGNCFGVCSVTTESTVLKGENGFVAAVELIGGQISKILENEEGILDGIRTWLGQLFGRKLGRVLKIGGSPKYSLHDIDFGWGIPKRCQYSYAGESVVVLNRCNDPQDALEIGLSLPKQTMDAFITIFHDGLNRA